jgi:uncharacterized membrane protein YebE (DUF533 family)
MDPEKLLEQLLAAGKTAADKAKELGEQGVDFAAEKMGISDDPQERADALKKLGAGAAVGSVLALLIGTKTGRKIASPALKIGTVAALGGIGYKIYSDWQKSLGNEANGQTVDQLNGDEASQRSLQLVSAVIAGAKADGHVDASELQHIESQMSELELSEAQKAFLLAEIGKPLDVDGLAEGATTPEAAVETYLAATMLADPTDSRERSFLDELAAKLSLPQDLIQKLEAGAA